jgi:glutamate/tyrosine decarboxylase-like PLP-dependent enzyme
VLPPAELNDLVTAVDACDLHNGRPAEEVIRQISKWLSEWQVHTTHPRYFGLFNPDTFPITAAADAIAASYNPQLAAFSHSPAMNLMEQKVLGIFLQAVGMPLGVGVFTSGGSEANQSAVAVALTEHIPSYAEAGASGSPILYVSAEAHHSFVKIAHLCGIGREAVRVIPVDQDLRMHTGALQAAIIGDLELGNHPFMVVATAGTTAAGAIDPLSEIAEIARSFELWLHVDAAWAGPALLSQDLATLLKGIEKSDSVTIDAHKLMSVPMGAGMFLCRHPAAMERTFAVKTTYMPEATEYWDPYNSSIQWSRRATGLKVFMALAHQGVDGYARLMERQCAMGHRLAELLRSAGFQVLHESPLAVVCFKHPASSSATILKQVYAHRNAWISLTRLSHHGEALRACITNYRTSESDIEALVEELVSAVRVPEADR